MMYIQTALALNGAAVSTPEPTSIDAYPADRGVWIATQRHTFTPSGRRLSGDLWDEYRFECESRDRLQLPEVSLAEFRDMRDWSDRIEEQKDDDDWITEPNTDAPPYGIATTRVR
ncbi:MAG: hypothetical protein ACYDAR_10470 [Thermomicrobiales bacterium]